MVIHPKVVWHKDKNPKWYKLIVEGGMKQKWHGTKTVG